MCRVCDNPEGNLCRNCEREVAEVKADDTPTDGWWPMMLVRRSINIASSLNEAEANPLYV